MLKKVTFILGKGPVHSPYPIKFYYNNFIESHVMLCPMSAPRMDFTQDNGIQNKGQRKH